MKYPLNPKKFAEIFNIILNFRQYAEKWDDVLFYMGTNEYISESKLTSIMNIGFFNLVSAHIWAIQIK